MLQVNILDIRFGHFFLNTYMYLFPDDEEKKLAEHLNDQKTVTESQNGEKATSSALQVGTSSDKQSQDVINSSTTIRKCH